MTRGGKCCAALPDYGNPAHKEVVTIRYLVETRASSHVQERRTPVNSPVEPRVCHFKLRHLIIDYHSVIAMLGKMNKHKAALFQLGIVTYNKLTPVENGC